MSFALFAFVAGAGMAIILVCCLALLGIVGFFFLTYFAHCFLLVIVDSAAGINEIRWPSEGFSEWITKPIYVGWVMLPLVMVSSIAFLAADLFVFLVTLLALMWLVAPVMYLSSLAAKSWMAFLYGPFLARWSRFLFAYIIFLAWSAPLVAFGGGLMIWALKDMRGVALSIIFVPACFLLYCRVLGRYAWYVTTRRIRKPKRKKMVNPAKGLTIETLDPWGAPAETTTEAGGDRAHRDDETAEAITAVSDGREKFAPDESRDKVMAAETRDRLTAAEQEPIVEDEWTPNKKPYMVMTESQARESWVERPGDPATEAGGYDVENLSIGPPVSLWQYYSAREKKEEELRAQGKSVRQFERPRKPPTLWQAMTQEIVGFLFFGHTLRCWMTLGILFGMVLSLLNIIVGIALGLGVA